MAGRLIGDAYIVIYPQTDAFGTQTEAAVKKALAGVKPSVNITPNLNAASMAKVQGQLNSLGASVNISAQLSPAQLAKLKAQIAAAGGGATIKPNINAAAATAQLTSLQKRTADLVAELASLKANVSDAGAEAKIAAMQVKANALADALARVGSGANLEPFESKLTTLGAAFAALKTAASAAAAANDDAAGPIKRAGDAASSTGKVIQATNGSWFALGSAVNNISRIHIPLFATSMTQAADDASILDKGLTALGKNFLTSASGFHLAAEAVIEFTAVWGPATLALTLFGAAAIPTAEQVYQQLKNMNTVSTATAANFKNVSQQGQSLSTAIRPEVMELFGEALIAANTNSGQLTKSLQAVGRVLDDFGAKIDQVLQSNTTSKFLSNAAGDVHGLGVAFQEIGRIIGTLLSDVPGYAAILLKLGDAALTAAADIVQAGSGIIKAFLAIHGAVFYIGLATTVLGTMGKAAVTAFQEVGAGAEETAVAQGKLSGFGAALGSLAGNMVQFGRNTVSYSSGIKKIATGAEEFEGATGKGAAASKIFGDALGAIPFNPVALGAVAVAAAIGGALYFSLQNSADASQKLAAQQQKLIASSNIVTVQGNIATAMKNTDAAISDQKGAVDRLTQSFASTGAYVENIGFQKQVQQQTQENEQALQKYADENANAAIRLNSLGKAYGDTTSVMELMNLAGVKQSDVATANAQAWGQDLIKIQAVAEGYGVMGQQAGTAGNQLDTLAVSTGSVTKAVQTLTGAEQQWLSLITGGDTAFTSFEQGQKTLAADMAGGSAAGIKLTATSGKLKDALALVKTSLSGTSDSAIAARQAFDAQITAGGQLYGNLQTLSAASGNTKTSLGELGKAGKDIVAQLLPMAAGSKQATAEVYALAQVVGYTGADSFQGLAKWVGNTKNAEGDLNSQQAKLTESSAQLSQAAKNLANTLTQDVAASQGQALLSTSGFQKAQNNLINTLQQSRGEMDANAKMAAGQYYTSLTNAGISNKDAAADVDALLQKLHVTPSAISAVNAMLGAMKTANDSDASSSQKLTQANQQLQSRLSELQSQGKLSQSQVEQLTSAMEKNKGQVDTSKDAFIQFAENGLKLTQSQAETLWGQLKDLAGTYAVNVPVSVSGGGTVSVVAAVSASGQTTQNILGETVPKAFSGGMMLDTGMLAGYAGGGRTVPGTSSSVTGDNHLVAVKSGELIIPSQHAPKFRDMARKASIPGFASGGILGAELTSTGIGPAQTVLNPLKEPAFADSVGEKAVAALRASLNGGAAGQALNALAQAAAQAMAAQISLAGVSNASAVAALQSAAAKAGWTGVQWTDLEAVEMREAGFSLTATNPTSGAYGMAQFINGPSEYALYGGNASTAAGQAVAMVNYIKSRYGTPAAALAHENAFGWYNQGGAVRPYSAGGMVSEPVFGVGSYSGMPYSFAEHGPEYVGPAQQAPHQFPPMSDITGQKLVRLMEHQNKLLAQQPYAQAGALRESQASGVRRGFFSTGG